MNDLLAGRYQIIKKIGSGGMAIVYLAKDLSLDRKVAIKVLREEYTEDSTFRRHFQKEAVAIAKLSHNNIVGIYDIITEDETMCLVMEYIEGETLKDKINRDGAMPWQQVVKYGIQIANALAYAHSNQIIHKDVKSQNIIIDKHDTVKITDFGISQMMNNTTITHNKGVLGSAHYFSPEQARGEKLSYQTDVYSLGVVLYEMLIGELPFTADNPVSVALKHIQEPAKNVHMLVNDIPESLGFIVSKCLEKNPENRFASMQALSKALSSLTMPNAVSSNLNTPLAAAAVTTAAAASKAAANANRVQSENNSTKPKQNVTRKAPANKKKKKKKTNILVLFGILLAVLAITLFISQKLFPPSELTAPDFRGMTITAAEDNAKQHELTVIEAGSEFSDDYAAGEIMSQTPRQGSNVSKGDTISVIISKGTEDATVPDVVGKNLDAATKLLKENNLDVGTVTEVYSDSYDAGEVVYQETDAGTKLEKGSLINLQISLGAKPQSIVPDMIGNDLETAQTQLANAKLNLGSVTYQESDEPEGYVLSQGINPGSEVDQYTTVNIVVSAGKAEEPSNGNNTNNNGNNTNNGNNSNGNNSNGNNANNNGNNSNAGGTNKGDNTAPVIDSANTTKVYD